MGAASAPPDARNFGATNSQPSTAPVLDPLHAGIARDPLLPPRGQALSSIESEDRSDAGDDNFEDERYSSEDLQAQALSTSASLAQELRQPLRGASTSAQHVPPQPPGS